MASDLSNSVPRRTAEPAVRPPLGTVAIRRLDLVWLLVALVVALGSLIAGTSAAFVAFQFCVLAATLVGWRVLAPLSPVVAMVFLATMGKNFVISQFVKLAMFQPADAHLSAPVKTAAVMFVAALGSVTAGLLWRTAFPPRERKGLIVLPNSPAALLLTGHLLAFVGICGDLFGLVLHGGSVVFHYLSYAVFGAIVAYGLHASSKDKRKVVTLPMLGLVGLHLLAAINDASRTALMEPFVMLAGLYALRGRSPSLRTVAGALALLFLIVTVISPTVNFSRRGGSQLNRGEVFKSDLAAVIENPSLLSTYKHATSRYEADLALTSRLYYGEPTGLLDRFTPSQVDNLVSAADYASLSFRSYIGAAFKALLPQTFGAVRGVNVGQADLESLTTRANTLGLNNANYGIAGNLFVLGGYAPVAAGFLFFTLAQLAALQVLFGSRHIWSLPFLPMWLFQLADGSVTQALIVTVHGSIILGGALYLIHAISKAVPSTPASGPGGRLRPNTRAA